MIFPTIPYTGKMSKPLKRTVTPRACPPNRPQPTQPSRGHETQPCTALEHLKLLLNALFPRNNCLNLLNATRKPLKRAVTGTAGPPNNPSTRSEAESPKRNPHHHGALRTIMNVSYFALNSFLRENNDPPLLGSHLCRRAETYQL